MSLSLTTERVPSHGLSTIRHEAMLASERIAGVELAIAELKAIRTFVANEMKPGIDFGVIPGAAKPSLLLPGAQKIALYYNCQFVTANKRTELGSGHLEVESHTQIVSRTSGKALAEGHGTCTSMESKYRWRQGERVCPKCGKAAIIKGNDKYGGGWLCYQKKGGCNAKFVDADLAITSQNVGRVENPDIYDLRNTVLKMSIKRSEVAASHNLGCLSELFTQDIEDFYDLSEVRQNDVINGDARRAAGMVSEAAKDDHPVIGYVGAGYDDRPYTKVVTDAIEAANHNATTVWKEAFPSEPCTLPLIEAPDLHRVLHAEAAALSYVDDSKPGSVRDAVKRLGKVYVDQRAWLRGRIQTLLESRLEDMDELVSEKIRGKTAAKSQDADDVLDATFGDVTDDAGPGDGPEDREA